MEPSVSASDLEGGTEKAVSPNPTGTGDAHWRAALWEVLRWCLPALLIGLALRVALTWSMPYGYVQYDSSDYLITTQRLIEDHRFYIHDKRSYLTPMLFSAAFLLPVPAVITIAAAQHVMGLIATLVVGALVRMWFRFWKVAIIPVTVLFAGSPFIVWYEHTIMGEAQFLFFTLLMVFAGTLFARRPTTRRFIWFIVSLLAAFGTRLESKTFLLFAVLLVVMTYGWQWRRTAIGFAVVMAAYFVAFHVSGDRDVSSLVYASLIRFAPTESRSTPDIMPDIVQIRERARELSVDYPTNLVRIAKQINNVVQDYVAARVQGRRAQAAEEGRIVRGLCIETLEAEPVKTLMTPWTKFHLAVDAWSSYCFDRKSLWQNQFEAYTMKEWMTTILAHGLTGEPVTKDDLPAWLRAHYSAGRVLWFTNYQHACNRALIFFRFPDKPMPSLRWVHDYYGESPDWEHFVPGLPFFYIVALLGMILAFACPGQLRAFHFAWVATVLGGLYVCSMVGVTNGRFRFVYEPFLLLYFFIFFDILGQKMTNLLHRREAAPACST